MITAILATLAAQPWAMDPRAFDTLVQVLSRWGEGQRLTDEQIRAAVGEAPAQIDARRQAAAAGPGSVAVLPVYGAIAHRAHMVRNVSGPGGTSSELLGQAITKAAADPSIGAIVLDVDSPGGSVAGTPELVDRIVAAREQKPVVAVANALAASAGYWIGSAASEFVATPSAQVGSVGVLAVHEDRSAEHAAAGRKLTFIHAGKYKVEGNSAEPLSDDARGHIQAMVDTAYDTMIKSIARNRGVTPADVREKYGEGRVFTAEDALARGMVDRIETLEATIERLANPRRRARVSTARNALRIAAL